MDTSKQPQHNQLASATGQWLGHNLFAFFIHGPKPEKRFAMPNKETATLQYESIWRIDNPGEGGKSKKELDVWLNFEVWPA
jgi:hypothetical protein